MQELAPTSPRVGPVLQYLRDRPTPTREKSTAKNSRVHQVYLSNCAAFGGAMHNTQVCSRDCMLLIHSVFFAGKPGNTPGFPDGGDSPGGDVTMRWLTRTPGTLGNRVHIGVYMQFCADVCCSMLIIERKRMLESENETNTTIQNYRRGFWRELSAIDGCWKWKFCKMRKLKAYSTRYSQAVTHPSIPGSTLLNFGDRTRTGAFNVIWP